MCGEILGFERRRRWSDEEKLEIVMAVGVDDATVTQVAQRHEITRQQICAWRHDLKNKGLWSPDANALFLPFDIPMHGIPTIADTPIITAPMAVETNSKVTMHQRYIIPGSPSPGPSNSCRDYFEIC
jgi:transposase